MDILENYRHTDTRKPDGVHIQWAMIEVEDDCRDAPDKRQDGFWPSRDEEDCGYIPGGYGAYRLALAKAETRMRDWQNGVWNYIGVIAEARIMLVRHGHGTYYTLRSAGCFGIESDAGDYLAEVFAEEKAALLADLKALGAGPYVEEDPRP